jgi:hypothetical protein
VTDYREAMEKAGVVSVDAITMVDKRAPSPKSVSATSLHTQAEEEDLEVVSVDAEMGEVIDSDEEYVVASKSKTRKGKRREVVLSEEDELDASSEEPQEADARLHTQDEEEDGMVMEPKKTRRQVLSHVSVPGRKGSTAKLVPQGRTARGVDLGGMEFAEDSVVDPNLVPEVLNQVGPS